MYNTKDFMLIIDTNLYSGNFEREMCAHITGVIGECEVGNDHIGDCADIAEELNMPVEKVSEIMAWMEQNISQRCDEGCYRPCAIYPTEGRSNNGNGRHYNVTPETPYKWPAYESIVIYLSAEPTKEIFDFIVARAKSFKYPAWKKSESNPELEVKGVHILVEERVVNVTKTIGLSVKF